MLYYQKRIWFYLNLESTCGFNIVDPLKSLQGIINVTNPASTPFLLYLEYDFPNPQFQGSNATPSLLQPLSDIAIIGQDYTFNSNAYDPDGDSLAYEIEPSFLEEGPKLYPNPISRGWVMVEWPDNEDYEYVLYNSVGERLLQGNAISQFLPLNISYPNGMYWLKVNNEKKSWSLPLIIQ
jgi:hypothetical protein